MPVPQQLKPNAGRDARAEAHYRNSIRETLTEYLRVVNPQDVITWGAMSYEQLVAYALDFMKSEAEHLLGPPEPKPSGLPLE